MHFFFDTTAAGNAGENGDPPGSWELWGLRRGGGRKVFDTFTVADGAGASQLCVAVRRHTITRCCRTPTALATASIFRRDWRYGDDLAPAVGPADAVARHRRPPADASSPSAPPSTVPPEAGRHQAWPSAAPTAVVARHLIEHARRDAVPGVDPRLGQRTGGSRCRYPLLLDAHAPAPGRRSDRGPAHRRASGQLGGGARPAGVRRRRRAARTGLWRLLTRLGDERPLL